MVKGDFHYWDFPEGSDTHNWFREHAANRSHYDAAQRNYKLYWKPRLDNMKVGPTLVKTSYKQEQLEREMQYEINNPWSSNMMNILNDEDIETEVITKTAKEVAVKEEIAQEVTTNEVVAREIAVNEEIAREVAVTLEIAREVAVKEELANEFTVVEEKIDGPVKEEMIVVEEEMVVVEMVDDDEDDDCAFGIRLCMSV